MDMRVEDHPTKAATSSTCQKKLGKKPGLEQGLSPLPCDCAGAGRQILHHRFRAPSELRSVSHSIDVCFDFPLIHVL